jgi:nucleotide-binding universal stress UspA family protein
MYDRLLVPTDGSPGSRGVIEHAADLAEIHGATLHGLYVVNTASYASFSMESAWEGIGGMLRREGEEALAAVGSVAGDRVPVETAVFEGSPSRKIVRYAEREGCDLIVMGTHGRGGIDRLLLGSVAERVVRSSEVPVLTVRVGSADDG